VPTVAAQMLALRRAVDHVLGVPQFGFKTVPHHSNGFTSIRPAVGFMTSGLERFLEPLSQVLLPSAPPSSRQPLESQAQAP